MNKVNGFCHPMEYTGIPNTSSWMGYDYLQWTGSIHHPGLDYNWGAGEQDLGKPVFAIANGVVEYAEKWNGISYGYGNYIIVKHTLPSGEIIYSVYCHLNSIKVNIGQEVSMGETIGTCGGSGGWPSHLHLEIRKPIGKGYAFWPKGYSKEWIADHYYDPYTFIEEHKNMSTQTDSSLTDQQIKDLQTDSNNWKFLCKKYDISDTKQLVAKIDFYESKIKTVEKQLETERENHAKDNGSNTALIEKLRTDLALQEEKNTNLEAELEKADTSKDCDKLLKDQETKYVKTIKDLKDKLLDTNTTDEIEGSSLIDPEKQSLLLRFLIAILKK